mgnify:FL=1
MGYIYQTLTKQAAMDFPGYYWWGERFGRLAALRNPATPRGRILNETSHHSPASLQNYLTRLLSSANAGQANIYEYVKGLRNRVGEAGSLARMYQDPRKPRNWIRHLPTSGRGFWSY